MTHRTRHPARIIAAARPVIPRYVTPRHAAALIAALALSACTTEGDDYPALLPTAQILAEPVLPASVPATPVAEAASAAALASRADALRRRAGALRGPVLTQADRQAMTPRSVPSVADAEMDTASDTDPDADAAIPPAIPPVAAP